MKQKWFGVKETLQEIKKLDPHTTVTENALNNWIKQDKLRYGLPQKGNKRLLYLPDVLKFLGGKYINNDPRVLKLQNFLQDYYDPQAGHLCDQVFVNRLADDILEFLDELGN